MIGAFPVIGALLAAAPARAGLVAGGAPDLDAAWRPRRVAVLVGVQDYADPALQGLRFPAKDARDLGAALGDPDVGGFDRVLVVDGGPATTREGILDTVRAATADLQRDDTFLLYLSGHGTLTLDPAAGSRLWFLPADGRLDDPVDTGLDVAELERLVASLPARRRVLILDTCHNGRVNSKSAVNAGTREVLARLRGEPPAPREVLEVSESEARLFAAQVQQPAMEDPELENGVYTHYLIEALTSGAARADLDGDGLVDVAEAHDYARDRTIARTGGMQVPRAEYRIVGREEIFLAGDASLRSRAERALIAATDELLAQARLLVDGVPRGVLPGLTAVEPGRHLVEIQGRDGVVLARDRVRLAAGERLSVETLLAREAPRVVVLGGGLARHGPGRSAVVPWGGELEVGRWSAPVAGARLDLHLRADLASGTVPEQGDHVVTMGDVAAGASWGWRLGAVSVGPLVEGVVPWRSFENETGYHQQATLAPAVGARLLAPISPGGDLALRYDARFLPYRHDGLWTSLWVHGLALGGAFR